MSIVFETVLIAAAVWLLIKFLYTEIPSFRTMKYLRKLPGPKGAPLLMGTAYDFFIMETYGFLGYLEDMCKKYPRLAAFYLAGMPCVIVQKPQDIKHILGSNKNIQKGFEYGPLIPWLNEGLLTSKGAKWHMRRKLLTPTFHFKILDDSLQGMTHNSAILANRLSNTGGREVDIDDYITRCTLDIMGEVAMGVKLDTQHETKNTYLDAVKTTSDVIVKRILSVYQMKDSIFALTKNGWVFRKNLKILHSFTDKVINDRKKSSSSQISSTTDNDYGSKQRKAFLDSLLNLQKTNSDNFTDRDIREEVDTFMFEGHDTTSTALCFGLWLLGFHPEVQERLYQDIIEAVGDDEITMKNVNSINYLEIFIKETLRLYPSVPYISRRSTEDTVLDDGTIIPMDTNIIFVPYLIHRDPEQFPDPEKFDPERFNEENSKDRHPYAYIPFSAGPRNCIGQKFAMLEMKVTFASVIRKVKVQSITKREEFKILPNLIIRPSNPLLCKFIPRSK